MTRKRWTPKTEVTDSVLQFREKRKWQIALRRYVLDKNKSSFYAPYFGLDIEMFRQWIELQFDEELSWDNFSSMWQFDHILPLAYFDFSIESDLRLCWNFVNIQVEKTGHSREKSYRIDVLAAKNHFEHLYQQTGYLICQQMVEKINRIETEETADSQKIHDFIRNNSDYLEATASFSSDEFNRLNSGTSFKSLLFEKDFLKRLG